MPGDPLAVVGAVPGDDGDLLRKLLSMPPRDARHLLSKLSGERFKNLATRFINVQRQQRKERNLLTYQPVSPKSMEFHCSESPVACLAGGNRCLPLDAPVLMADGRWLPLGRIEPGDSVMAADPETGCSNPARVLRTMRSGRKAVYRITFSDGGSFEATLDHRVPMYLGGGRRTSKGYEKRPHKRVLRDYCEPIQRRGSGNPSKRIACVSPLDITPRLAQGKPRVGIDPYLLGVLLGDGSTTQRTARIHSTDDVIVDRCRTVIGEMGLELVKYKHGCEYGIRGGDVLYRELQHLGMQGVRDRDKRIPKACYFQGRTFRKALAAGLVDTDGTRDWFTSASHGLALDFARLIRSLGGKATLHERSTDSTWGRAWSVYWRMNERLPLSLPRKQAPESKRPVDYRRRICRSMEFSRWAECGDIEVEDESHCYITGDHVIVSNSSKTESCLAEIVMLATGVIPHSVREAWAECDRQRGQPEGSLLARKFRGPINARVVCESLTTTLHQTIMPKLQWWKWTGVDAPGGDRGHWGWIPRDCLIGGEWDRAWSEKRRVLRILCRDPEDYGHVTGESTIEFFSHDQDPSDFASGQCHIVLHDEAPRYAIWRENEARVLSVRGRLFLAMTWPDDPAIPVDWIFDRLYEPSQREDSSVEWINLWTTENPFIDQEAVTLQRERWDDATTQVRIYGKPIRFSNLIHPLFNHTEEGWCFSCGKTATLVGERDRLTCSRCESTDAELFCHVADFAPQRHWPTVWVLDPHPRKPHMYLWAQIDPSDDVWVVAEGETDAEPAQVAADVQAIEHQYELDVRRRFIDPNMGRSPSSSMRRKATWQEDFDTAGLRTDLADDGDVGRQRVNEWLRPDAATRRPRLVIHERCVNTIRQMSRYAWDEFRYADSRDVKQTPRAKDDDYPTMLKYLANADLTFKSLVHAQAIFRRRPGGATRRTTWHPPTR